MSSSTISTHPAKEMFTAPRVVHFLVADQSSFITGAIWGVNGGMDM
jgi:3-oxoacyl-[acyl-carrier protein] reductase